MTTVQTEEESRLSLAPASFPRILRGGVGSAFWAPLWNSPSTLVLVMDHTASAHADRFSLLTVVPPSRNTQTTGSHGRVPAAT